MGTVYHTFPCTLFENRNVGDLTFDITCRDNREMPATINFTYEMAEIAPADSVRFVSGGTQMKGEVKKLYISPQKKQWKHRYSLSVDMKLLFTFFDVDALPEAIVYSQGQAFVYKAKPSAWKSYAPVGYKIFEMIRVNEQH